MLSSRTFFLFHIVPLSKYWHVSDLEPSNILFIIYQWSISITWTCSTPAQFFLTSVCVCVNTAHKHYPMCVHTCACSYVFNVNPHMPYPMCKGQAYFRYWSLCFTLFQTGPLVHGGVRLASCSEIQGCSNLSMRTLEL